MDISLLAPLLQATIQGGTPILFATIGAILIERSGVLNLGIEGIMLVGAIAGFAGAMSTSNPVIGLLVALCAGAILGIFFGFMTITLRAQQTICGMALAIFGLGLSSFLGQSYMGSPLPIPFHTMNIPVLKDIPFLGQIFFKQDPLVYLAVVLAILSWYLVYRTQAGLHLRAVGQNPRAADTLGINVFRLRYLYTILGSALSAAGGAYITLAFIPSWQQGITSGRGWTAIALAVFSGWNPLMAIFGSYLFGGITALTLYIQASGTTRIPPQFLAMLPYIMTVLVLLLTTRRGGRSLRPKALAVPYDSEEN
jgi:simple sugar transport system permease protein